jgi:hypothetical protein
VNIYENILREAKGGVYIPCWVLPRASSTAVKGVHGKYIKVSLAAPPVDGKANKELIRYFSELTSRPKSSVSLVSGESSRAKTVFINSLTEKEFITLIS